MPSNWSEFTGKKRAPDLAAAAIPVPGTFRCQICQEDVDDAEYFQVARLLRWKCSQGHISVIEKFDL